MSSTHLARPAKKLLTAILLVSYITGCSANTQPEASYSAEARTTVAEGTSPSPTAIPTPTVIDTSKVETTEPTGASAEEAQAPAEDAVAGSDAQAALDLLNTLEVKGRAPKTGYSRAAFGQSWADTDHNGCDTRNDILRRDLTDLTIQAGTQGCVVLTGTLNDPYTVSSIAFQRGQETSTAVQIDHLVALSDAWQTGAQNLSEADRLAFANDPENLLAVDGPTNQKKSDGDAATWLPPNTGYRCTYVTKQIRVKAKYRLWVKQAEKDAMIRVLSSCEAQASAEEAAPTQEDTTQEPAPLQNRAPIQDSAPVQENTGSDVYYKNCSEARAAGAAPLYVGQPGYRDKLDGDRDGIACE